MKQQKFLISLLLIVISGCASVPQTTRLPQAEPPPLEDGWGRVYVTAGISNGVQLWSKHQVGPFLINDKEVGSTAKDEYILVDLRPGIYEATCTQHDPFNTTNVPVELQINAGEQRYFACDMAFADEADSLPEVLFLGGLSGFLTIASGEISFLKERPIDLYDNILSSYTKFTGVSDSQQSISPDREIQKDSSSVTAGEAPSSEATVTANVVTADEVESYIDISGTYISTYTGKYLKQSPDFRNENFQVSLVQVGEKITGTFGSKGKVWGDIIDGETIRFEIFATGGYSRRGTWKLDPVNNKLEGKMTSDEAENWHLTRIE